MNVILILSIVAVLLLGIWILNWKLKRTSQQLDEAIHKSEVSNAVIQNVKKAQEIKQSNAQRSSHDRTERMRSKGYLRD